MGNAAGSVPFLWGIFGGSGGEEGGGLLGKGAEAVLIAIHQDLQRLVQVQGEHTHKIFAIDLLTMVIHGDRKGLHHGQAHEGVDIIRGVDENTEVSHKIPPGLYKWRKFVYNGVVGGIRHGIRLPNAKDYSIFLVIFN
jgi:hypothetical protein